MVIVCLIISLCSSLADYCICSSSNVIFVLILWPPRETGFDGKLLSGFPTHCIGYHVLLSLPIYVFVHACALQCGEIYSFIPSCAKNRQREKTVVTQQLHQNTIFLTFKFRVCCYTLLHLQVLEQKSRQCCTECTKSCCKTTDVRFISAKIHGAA